MKQIQYKPTVWTTVLLCIALLAAASCKEAIYSPAEGDIIRLSAVPITIEPGQSVLITVSGMKANGHPMPGSTVVRLAADSGTFHDEKGERIEAVLLEGGVGKTTYRSDPTFTGEALIITASSGAAAIIPEQLAINLVKIEITQLFITANPLKLAPTGGTAEIIVTAYDSQTRGVPGQKIFLETTAGTLTPPSPIETDANGKVTATLHTMEAATVTATYKDIAKTIEIAVGTNEPPVAAFQYSPQDPLMGQAIYFTNTSTDKDGTIAAYQWSFGDGDDSTEENPIHRYPVTAEARKYQVVLFVTDDGGTTTSAAQTVAFAVVEDLPPVVDFSYTPGNPVKGETIQFISLSQDEDGTIDKYEWDFGDATPASNEANPRHTYPGTGVYAVTLKVTDNGNNQVSVTKPVTVGEKENQPPEAAFTYSPTNPRAGEEVLFNAETSTDPDGEDDIVEYAWDFGDGSEGPGNTGKLVTHKYEVTEEKTFTVTLKVTDTKGNQGAASVEITVRPTPVARFTFSPAEPTAPVTVTFDAGTSEGTIKTYKWWYGDGGHKFTTAAVVTHEYTVPGEFRVTLTVIDINDRTSTISMSLTVK